MRRFYSLALVWLISFGAMAAAGAPFFRYSNFCNRDGLVLNGKTTAGENRMVFDSDEASSLFFNQKVPLDSELKIKFAFTVELASEGFAMVLQSIGTNFLVVAFEFDTKATESRFDPDGNHISVHFPPADRKFISANELLGDGPRNNTILLLSNINITTTLIDGFEHVFTLTFNSETSEFLLNLDDKHRLRSKVPLLDARNVFIGFTSGGGGMYQINSMDVETSGRSCAPGFIGTHCDIDETVFSPVCAEAKSCEECVASSHCCAWCTASEECSAIQPLILNNQTFDAHSSASGDRSNDDDDLPQIKTSWCTYPVHVYRCKVLEFPSVWMVVLVIGSIGTLICCWFSYLLRKRREEDAKLASRARIRTQPRMVSRRRHHNDDDDVDEDETDPEDLDSDAAEMQRLRPTSRI